MKRPQGFDRPPAPRAAVRTPPGKPPSRPHDTPPPEVLGRRGQFDSDSVPTDPIPVLGGDGLDRPEGAAAPARHDAESDADGERSDAPVPSAANPLSDRAARRALAAAARERRRYERQEVRRFTKRSRRRRITWAVVAGSIVALVATIAIGAYSPLMALREVRVEGAQRIPAAEVQQAFAGIVGTPLPLIDGAEVYSALSKFPLIETYATETIPPGTLVVRIVERTPVGVIETDSGLELVDAAGVVIDRPTEVPEGQPLIETEGGVADEGFRAVAAVVRSLPAEVRAQVVGATADTADDVELDLAAGARVVWGSAEDSELKADVLASLMLAAPPDTVSRYDVSAPTSPVTE
ncbi:FtsQ-type POTRA domain-containing protein [Agromyces sp. Marseille-P2726]|uniref:FtsQ-type POTRA domain-containing protein n=1 Tax=Agromyces sp. Marseille-P2726 TaxID=2709132 RepID=UPI0020C48494|nr:FtsQ-type POTRA domain-containing protein [Agromyces sp. Marseille-P2726]